MSHSCQTEPRAFAVPACAAPPEPLSCSARSWVQMTMVDDAAGNRYEWAYAAPGVNWTWTDPSPPSRTLSLPLIATEVRCARQ
jgi:hypothetical protein